MSERQPIDLDDLQRVGVLVREKTDDNWLADMVEIACDEIARLREERRSISTLLGKVESLEADNAKLREERRWISVNERLPDSWQSVLWRWRNGSVFVFPFDGKAPQTATHWQPLPPGPEANG